MEIIKNEVKDDIKGQSYRKRSTTFFVLSIACFIIFLCEVYLSGTEDLSAVLSGGIIFILSLALLGISAHFFLKYELPKESIALGNISATMAVGLILVVLILSWRLIVFVASRNIISTLQLSTVEWITIGIGIFLIASGYFKKSA
jgi:hypothetical protein